MNMNPATITATLTLATSLTDDDCAIICDAILDLDDMTAADFDSIMTAARRFDPTESDHAAHIRDTIRDNFEL